MIEKQIENGDVLIETTLADTEKVIGNTENASKNSYSRYRGQDKKPRKMHVNSLHNLMPLQSISDMNKLNEYAKNPYQKSASSWKLWVVFLIIIGIIAGYVIWRYNEKTRESYKSSFSDKLGGNSNG